MPHISAKQKFSQQKYQQKTKQPLLEGEIKNAEVFKKQQTR